MRLTKVGVFYFKSMGNFKVIRKHLPKAIETNEEGLIYCPLGVGTYYTRPEILNLLKTLIQGLETLDLLNLSDKDIEEFNEELLKKQVKRQR